MEELKRFLKPSLFFTNSISKETKECYAALHSLLMPVYSTSRSQEFLISLEIFFNLLFKLSEENEKLKAEIQRLRDAINLLKGEQAKPDIKPSRMRPNEDISSEGERKSKNTPKKKKSKAKKQKIKIDRVEV